MIRPATPQDFEAIKSLETQVSQMHTTALPHIFKPIDFTQESYQERLDNELSRIFVYETQDEILAYYDASFWDYYQDPMFKDMMILGINSVCVAEKAQGKGIGKALFNHAKALAREIGAQRIELLVWKFNQNAMEFYQHLGMDTKYVRLEIEV